LNATQLPPLLDELLRAPGPSGFEEPAMAVWCRAASFGKVGSDKIGSSFAQIGESAPLLAVFGHIDEIGLIVSHIDEQGLLWFEPLGYWDPQVLVGQRVAVRGRSTLVPGVIGRPPIHLLMGKPEIKQAVELGSLHIDIGATSLEEAAALVAIGDPVTFAAEPLMLAGERFASKAMDNRLGAYVALESLRRCAQGDPGPTGSVAAVATVMEEIGLHGAKTAAFGLEPDVAIAVDVIHETGAPGIDEKREGGHLFGSGPIIGRAPILSESVTRLLIETAEEEDIPFTIRGSGLGILGLSTGTDADAVHISRAGIPTGLVSIPLRYMHSPVEVADLRDIEGAVRLIAAVAGRLNSLDL
jgi:endoglucanase